MAQADQLPTLNAPTNRRLVLGIGTGRCGSHALAELLNHQPDANVTHEQPPLLDWQPYSYAKLNELASEGKTVMIDFTADWCANCKLNMFRAIDTEKVRELVDAN